MIAKKLN